jgi:Sulfotransferase family
VLRASQRVRGAIGGVPSLRSWPSSKPPSADDVLSAATAATGLDDYGERGFVQGLAVLAESLRSDARLTRIGRVVLSADLMRMLSNRLRFQRDVTRHPEILNERIAAPIIITGLPRTGTSKLHRMISADPRVQRLEVWKLLNPAPLPGEPASGPRERINFARVVERTLATQFPDYMAAHPIEALEPDEEALLMEMSFECVVSSLKTRAPQHRAFVEGRDPRPTYEYTRAMLQYLQWQDGGGRGRPWIMKSPLHIGNLLTLLDVFPDATVVHCHRDPRVAIVSFASLIEASRRMASDDVDATEIGADVLDFLSRQIERNILHRAEVGEERIIDVPYEGIRDDPDEVIGEIYARAGRKLTAGARDAMRQYAARRPEGHLGRHAYVADRYGLDREKIGTAFADYCERFGTMGAAE